MNRVATILALVLLSLPSVAQHPILYQPGGGAGCLSFGLVDVFINMLGQSPGTAVTTARLAAGTEIAANYNGWGSALASQKFAASQVALPAGLPVRNGTTHGCGYATQALQHDATVNFSTSELDVSGHGNIHVVQGWIANLPPNQGVSGAYWDLVQGIGINIPQNGLLQLNSGNPALACGGYGIEIESTQPTTRHSDHSGTVNTSGTTVTWVSGDNFDGLAATDTIVIAGTSYTVTGAVTSTSLTITAGAGSQTGVAYTKAGCVMGISPAGTIFFSLLVNQGNTGTCDGVGAPCAALAVYTTSGATFTQVGSNIHIAMGSTDSFGAFLLGNGEQGTFAGSISFQNIMVDYTNHTWPNLPH